MAQTTLTLGARHGPSRFLIALVMSDDCAKFQEDWLKGFREKVHVIVFLTTHIHGPNDLDLGCATPTVTFSDSSRDVGRLCKISGRLVEGFSRKSPCYSFLTDARPHGRTAARLGPLHRLI